MAKSYYDVITTIAERYRNLKSLKTVKGIYNRFQSNEDANYHNENAIMLAVHYGTETELEETKQLIVTYSDESNPKGQHKAYMKRVAMTSKLYGKLLKDLYKQYPNLKPKK